MSKKCKLSSLTVSMACVIMLSGCANTGADNLTSSFTNMFDESVEARPAWADEPLIAAEKCNSFSIENIRSFVANYANSNDLPPMNNADEAGIRAMETYTLAAVLINRAQLCMAESLELKSATELLTKEREILLSGTSMSKNEIEKHREYSVEAGTEIKSYSAEIDSIAPEKTSTFTLGIVTYLAGSYASVRVKDTVSEFIKHSKEAASSNVKAAKSSSNKTLGWLTAAVNVATTSAKGSGILYNIGNGMVDHVENLYNTGTYLVEYAESENLELPEDATSEFLSVSDWTSDTL